MIDATGKLPQTGEIAKLQDEIGELRLMVDDMRKRAALEHVVDRGLSDLNDKLAPLTSLLSRGAELSREESATLAAIRATLNSPNYSDLEEPLVVGSSPKTPAPKGGKPS